jgi:hypothetical protein
MRRCSHGRGSLSSGDIEDIDAKAVVCGSLSKQTACVRCPRHRQKFAGGAVMLTRLAHLSHVLRPCVLYGRWAMVFARKWRVPDSRSNDAPFGHIPRRLFRSQGGEWTGVRGKRQNTCAQGRRQAEDSSPQGGVLVSFVIHVSGTRLPFCLVMMIVLARSRSTRLPELLAAGACRLEASPATNRHGLGSCGLSIRHRRFRLTVCSCTWPARQAARQAEGGQKGLRATSYGTSLCDLRCAQICSHSCRGRDTGSIYLVG